MFNEDEIIKDFIKNNLTKNSTYKKYYDVDGTLYFIVRQGNYQSSYKYKLNENLEVETTDYAPPLYINKLYHDSTLTDTLYIAQSEEDCEFIRENLIKAAIYIEDVKDFRDVHAVEMARFKKIILFEEHNEYIMNKQTDLIEILNSLTGIFSNKNHIFVTLSPCVAENYIGRSPVLFTFDYLILSKKEYCEHAKYERMHRIFNLISVNAKKNPFIHNGVLFSSIKKMLTLYGFKFFSKFEEVGKVLMYDSVHIMFKNLWGNFVFSNKRILKFKEVIFRMLSRHGVLSKTTLDKFWNIKTTNRFKDMFYVNHTI